MSKDQFDREPFEFGLPDENVPLSLLIKYTERAIGNVIHERLEKLGMKRSFGPVLMTISHREGITQSELAAHMRLTAPSVSVALQKMEENGLVEKRSDASDQRQSRLYMTDKGRELSERTDRLFKEENSRLLSCLEEGEEQQLRSLLLKLAVKASELREDNSHN
ncbi:MAG: MarR family winged helix-turn-helix transcriptional regulator [Eubacteriales bacterium]